MLGKAIYLSWYSYILDFDPKNSSLSLFNPLTRGEITLPPTNLPMMNFSDCFLLCLGRDHHNNVEHVLISVTTSESNPTSHTVCFCKIGDDKWKTLELDFVCAAHTYYNRMFYAQNTETLVTEVTDVTTGSVLLIIPPPKHPNMPSLGFSKYLSNSPPEFSNFVESSGKLLAIMYRILHCSFVVYELEYENGNPKLVKTNNIGDQFIFLIRGSGSLSLKASDFSLFRPNCVYFVGDVGLVQFDISDASIGDLPLPDDVDCLFLATLQ